MEEAECYLSLGSNLGDRMGYLKQGVDLISGMPGVSFVKTSSVYETDPVGVTEQPPFLNIAVSVNTSLDPTDFLASLKEIEREVGRVHRERWREREIDIDIIFYGEKTIRTNSLTIPHEEAQQRRFVLQPLFEIAPHFEHPVLHKTVEQLLVECPDHSRVRVFQKS